MLPLHQSPGVPILVRLSGRSTEGGVPLGRGLRLKMPIGIRLSSRECGRCQVGLSNGAQKTGASLRSAPVTQRLPTADSPLPEPRTLNPALFFPALRVESSPLSVAGTTGTILSAPYGLAASVPLLFGSPPGCGPHTRSGTRRRIRSATADRGRQSRPYMVPTRSPTTCSAIWAALSAAPFLS